MDDIRHCTQAYITLATNDAYCKGALALGISLRNSLTTRDLVVMVCHPVSSNIRAQLASVYDTVVEVDMMDSEDPTHLALLNRPELGITFTKLHCWKLTQYEKCVFMDADMLVLKNIDELFGKEELSAVADVGWPDMFNSGLFVFKPSDVTFAALIKQAEEHGSFDGGDQGLLNSYFNTWKTGDANKQLSFNYNMQTAGAGCTYTSSAAYLRYGKNVKVIHFLGSNKPWSHLTTSTPPSGDNPVTDWFLSQWIACYNQAVNNTTANEQSTENIADDSEKVTCTFEVASSSSSRQLSGLERWQQNVPDYHGADAYCNIQAKINAQLNAMIDDVGASKEARSC